MDIEKARKQDLIDRFNNIDDMRLTFNTLYPTIANSAKFIKDLVENENHGYAEQKIKELEDKYIELSTSNERIQSDYIEARNREYLKRGVTRDAIMEAQWERDMEGRPEKANELQAIRLSVKIAIPKPTIG